MIGISRRAPGCFQFSLARAALLTVLGSVLGIVLGSGCSGPVKVAEIVSDPTGATIFVDGERVGITPAKVKFSFSDDPEQRVLIQVVKHGRQSGFQYWKVDEVMEKKVFTLGPD